MAFPLLSALRDRLDVPFVVDNDVNLAALGHAWKGDARGLSDFVILSLGTGIGAAVVVDGRLLRGRNSGAGEVGYMVLDRDLLRAARPGDLGSFETLASGIGVAMLARDALRADGSHSSLRSLPHEVTSFDLFAAADAGDAIATDIIASVVDYVAMVVIALGSVVDPDVVVLDGSVGLALARWAPDIEALAARHLPTHPRVLTSSLAGEATALGAVAAALDLSRAGRGNRSTRPVGAQMPRPAAMTTEGVGRT